MANSAGPDQIWIYTVCKGRVYLSSAGQGLIDKTQDVVLFYFCIFLTLYEKCVCLIELLLMSTHNILFCAEMRIILGSNKVFYSLTFARSHGRC